MPPPRHALHVTSGRVDEHHDDWLADAAGEHRLHVAQVRSCRMRAVASPSRRPAFPVCRWRRSWQ